MTTDIDVSANGHAEGEAGRLRVLDALGHEFSPESLRILSEAAITPEAAAQFGITAVSDPDHIPDEIYGPWNGFLGEAEQGMIFQWRDLGRTVPQYRPDEAVRTPDGKTHKYLAPKESGAFLNHLRDPVGPDDPYLFVEGSKQGVSAAAWAPEGWGVVAVPGCYNWVGTDLTWADMRKVIILFDADFTTNRDVYDAAAGLKEALDVEGADEVVFAHLAGARNKEGLDDVLGRRPVDRRTSYIQKISDMATPALGRRPARSSRTSAYFDDRGLLARTSSLAVLDGQPAALADGSMIALYRDGVFRIDLGREPLIEKVKGLLEEDFRPSHRATIEEYLIGELSERGLRVGGRSKEPVLNTATCMIDLRTGEMLKHDPSFLSTIQIPVGWDPDAACPTYEAWLESVIPDQAEALEEIAATMLDPSRTPLKQVFLFGPTHSGKSTFLRIMQAVAGHANTSAVDLHQLADDKFMSAEVYQKMLNIGSDLSAAHVSDVSLFKKLTGKDPVQANRKYGKLFSFTNRALFAFSANDIPTVNETSRAYVQRMAPFRFDRSFAGNERPEIEERMLHEELPGILRRWVSAWRRFSDRGLYLPVPDDVQAEFETSSDRVSRWVQLRCDVHPDVVGQLVGPEGGDTVSSLYIAFKTWAREDSPANVMSRTKFSERLRAMDGVGDVRLKHRNKNLGLNITTRTGEDREIVRIRSVRDESGSGGCDPVSTGDAPVCDGVTTNVGVGVQVDTDSDVNVGVGVGGVGEIMQTPTRVSQPEFQVDTVQDHVKDSVSGGGGLHDLANTTHTHTDPHRKNEENDHGQSVRNGLPEGEGIHHPGPESAPRVDGAEGVQADGRTEAAAPEADVREQRDHGLRLSEGDLGSSVDRSGPATVKQPTLPTPHEEYFADPFADHAPPPPSVPVGLDLETWDADDLFLHDTPVLGPYVRLVGAGPSGDVATGGCEVLDRIRGGNTLVGVNLALFDLPALDIHEGIRVEDTIPRAHDIRFVAFQDDPPTSSETQQGPRFKHYNLESLCQRYLGDHKSDLGKALAKEYGGWGHIAMTDRRYHDYGRDDVEKALSLAAVLPMTDYDRREMEIAAITARMTLEGFRVDLPALQRKIAEQAQQSAAGRLLLHDRFGFPTHTADGKHLSKAPQRTTAGKAAFEAALKSFGVDLSDWPRGKDGTLSLAKEIMAEVIEWAEKEGHPALPVMKAVQEMNGLRSNAENLYRRAVNGRIHQNFEPFQAFGRWSAGNLTTLKKAAEDSDRIFLLPDEGEVLVSFDADQVDIRCVTYHSQDPGLLAIMQDPGRDIHSEISDLAFGRHDDPYRFHSKSMDLGWLYGRSVNGLAQTPGIPDGAAERVDETMRRQFGQVIDWQHEVRIRAEGRAILDNGYGRHFRCDEGREYTQAPAGHGQSMTRDVVGEGLLTMKRNHPELIPRLRVIVHDEIVMSVPKDDVEDVKRAVIADMTTEKGGVPFTWGSSPAGDNWAECYRK
jgi:putative DNA primase/helicase